MKTYNMNSLYVERLNKNNMRECFGYLIDKLKKRAVDELPIQGGEGFRGIAESRKVNEPSFAANVISFAIRRITFDLEPNTYAIELHALSYKLGFDTYSPLGYGYKQKMLDRLDQKEELIDVLIATFYDIDESIAQKCMALEE